MQLKNSPWQVWATCREGLPDESTEPVVGCLGMPTACTAKASGISRKTVKSGCAREWGGWGQLSEDGPGQHNPDRSEDPWGRAAEAARTEVRVSASSLTQSRESRWQQSARRAMANQCTGKAASDIPALKPYRGKLAVRNFRGDGGNAGIIEARLAPPSYSTVRTAASPNPAINGLDQFAPRVRMNPY